MPMVMEKREAHRLVDQMHEFYVREAIERGLSDSKEGRTRDVLEVREEYGLPA